MNPVLLLNASYEPLHICSWKRAVLLLLKGKAETVERNGKQLCPGMPMPVVIRLRYYIKMPFKEIPMTRKNVMHRDNHTCQYCGRKADLTIDHVIPRSKGGKDTWDNVVIACLRCNVTKGDRTPAEAQMALKRPPVRPFNFVQFELSKQQQAGPKEYEQWKKYLFEYTP